jgi:hypothetical protein
MSGPAQNKRQHGKIPSKYKHREEEESKKAAVPKAGKKRAAGGGGSGKKRGRGSDAKPVDSLDGVLPPLPEGVPPAVEAPAPAPAKVKRARKGSSTTSKVVGSTLQQNVDKREYSKLPASST